MSIGSLLKKGKDLQIILQKAQPSFAYQVLALEIQLEQSNSQYKVQSLSRLLQLYMQAVEVLQSKADKRYKYFSNKLQNIVKKKIVMEQMQRKTNKKLQAQLLLQARRAQMGQKKQDYNMQVYLSNQLINPKKVQQMVDHAQNNMKKIQSRVKGAMISQDKDLQQRIKRRKMRSQAGSVQKFKVVKGHVVQKNIAGQKIDAFFQPWDPKIIKTDPQSIKQTSTETSPVRLK